MTCLCNVAATEVEKAKSTKFKISVSDNLSISVIWIRALLMFIVAVQWLKADGCHVGPRWNMGVSAPSACSVGVPSLHKKSQVNSQLSQLSSQQTEPT